MEYRGLLACLPTFFSKMLICIFSFSFWSRRNTMVLSLSSMDVAAMDSRACLRVAPAHLAVKIVALMNRDVTVARVSVLGIAMMAEMVLGGRQESVKN